MNQREARKRALSIASSVITRTIDSVDFSDTYPEDDAERIEKELEKIAQQLFNKSQRQARAPR